LGLHTWAKALKAMILKVVREALESKISPTIPKNKQNEELKKNFITLNVDGVNRKKGCTNFSF
jgi:hypothetical protein